MKRKLQVFVSSTYTDMQAERQAAVQAILDAGHIPAGMELFTATDESQLAVIERWIDESDVFLLILGGRYGSIEPKSGKSYIDLEYHHALNADKEVFALVLTDAALDAKARQLGLEATEQKHSELYQAFKDEVQKHLCAFVSDTKDVKYEIVRKLSELNDQPGLGGWVHADVAHDLEQLLAVNQQMKAENDRLKAELDDLKAQIAMNPEGSFVDGLTFDQLHRLLSTNHVSWTDGGTTRTESLLSLLVKHETRLSYGVTNAAYNNEDDKFLARLVAPQLAVYGLVEGSPYTGGARTFQLSSDGHRFLRVMKLKELA